MNARSQLRILNIQGKGGIGSPGKKTICFSTEWGNGKAVCSTHIGTRGTTVLLKSCFHFISNLNFTIMLNPWQKVWLL